MLKQAGPKEVRLGQVLLYCVYFQTNA